MFVVIATYFTVIFTSRNEGFVNQFRGTGDIKVKNYFVTSYRNCFRLNFCPQFIYNLVLLLEKGIFV